MDKELLLHKEQFENWLFKRKGNASLISKEYYDKIVKYLLGIKNHDQFIQKKTERYIIKRVKRHGYRLCSYEGLGLHNVLCIAEKVRFFPHFCLFSLFSFFMSFLLHALQPLSC